MRFISTLCAVALMTPAAGFSQMPVPAEARVDAGSRVRIAAPVFGTGKQIATVVSVTRHTRLAAGGEHHQPIGRHVGHYDDGGLVGTAYA
jgi:hypothetical protein